jgi:hypothetical protein
MTAALRTGLLRHIAFDSRRNVIRICLAVCLLTMLASLLLGQDSNWDLRNYHLYNGWAALHGRLSIDLAPAQMQSYFVPWLDAGYYLLAVKGTPVLAAAVLGALHGLAFAAVAAVAWLALAGDPRRPWLTPLLALAGCCSAAFFSEVGNTMGDNTTASLVIGALALTLRAAHADAARRWLLAGVLLGLALAFKLTNGPYALGLGAAALATGGPWRRRLRDAALLTVAALVVFVMVAGPWLYLVWKQFGNPVFPMFNQWFHAPLALPLPSNDTKYLPENPAQMLVWPLIIAANPYRMSEIGLYQPVWGILYLVAALAVVQAVLRRAGRGWSGLPTPNPMAARMLAVFVVVSFVAWMEAFSIQRYLIALELVAPLALWLLTRHALPAASTEKWAAGLIAVCAVTGCVAAKTWGHESWTRRSFAIEAPRMEHPETATVLLVGWDLHRIRLVDRWGHAMLLAVAGEPQSWRIPFLPKQAAYVGIVSMFPSSPRYEERARQIAIDRGGAVYALFPGAQDDAPCHCSLLPPREGVLDQNHALVERTETQLRARGWQLQRQSCTIHASYIGNTNFPFHWCEVTRLP